jgi:hypothetical protein
MTITPSERQWLDNLTRQTLRDVAAANNRSVYDVLRSIADDQETEEHRSFQTAVETFRREQERRQKGQQHDPTRNPYRRGPSSTP